MLEARRLKSIAEVEARDWNALNAGGVPFLRHEFLHTLEATGCVGRGTGWTPAHLVLHGGGKHPTLVGALPLYEKSHSWGEFVFDFSWAEAYARHGDRYYPKLVAAIPVTPVTGPRVLVSPADSAAAVREALTRAAEALAEERAASSVHAQFPTAEEAEFLGQQGWLPRLDCQFHWFNKGYADFEGFLQSFTAEKRKKAKRERRRVLEAGIDFEFRRGGELSLAEWRTVHRLHALTFHRHGHEPYLSLEFFATLSRVWPEQPVVALARRGREVVATAIFFEGSEALYGRYWGASADYHSLHFETCYHQGIEFAIRQGLARFEPGTQGLHKLARGFTPTLTHSAHFIRDPRYRRALAAFLSEEGASVRDYANAASRHLPFRRIAADRPLDLEPKSA